MPSYQSITIYTAPAMFHVQGVLINTEEALDNVDWNPMCIHSIWTPLLTLIWYLIEVCMYCHHFQVYCICTVSLLSIIIIFTTDNFVKHKCSQDINVVYSG